TKAAAYSQYNQAALLDKVVSNLPEIVRALAEPLSKVDKISIVSTGSGSDGNLGASRITGDMVAMLAQVPAVLQAVTGLRMDELLSHVPGIRTVDASAAAADATAAPAAGAQDAQKPAAAEAASASSTDQTGDGAATANGSTPDDHPSDRPNPSVEPVAASVASNGTAAASSAPSRDAGPRRRQSR
ncbi:MAG: hypothetical protein ACHQ4H_01670, partial [Ktedonobacterales bacterium]